MSWLRPQMTGEPWSLRFAKLKSSVGQGHVRRRKPESKLRSTRPKEADRALRSLVSLVLGRGDPSVCWRPESCATGKGVSLRYGPEWLNNGFPLSEELPLNGVEFLPAGRLDSKHPRAVGAVDDARPDRWGEKVIRFVDEPHRLSLMEFLYCAGDDRFGALGSGVSTVKATSGFTAYQQVRPSGQAPRADKNRRWATHSLLEFFAERACQKPGELGRAHRW